MRRLWLVPLVLLAGCGSSSPTKTVTVQKERVEVVPPSSSKPGVSGFDAQAIYARDAPGVVTILSIYGSSSVSILGGGGEGAEGSGFVIDGNGEIATNAHVVTQGQGASIRPVAQVYVKFTDRNQVSAHIVGYDPNEDVALLKIDPANLTLRPLTLGNSTALKVGAPVAAIGSPFGEESSLSVGVVSAKDRTIDSLTRFQISGAIQTDAAINHGNSGGPLVDADGRVVGINSQINSSSGDNSGVGFAIPIDSVKRSLDALRASGHVDYAYLGVSTQTLYPQLAKQLGMKVDHGAILATLVSGGPADKAGLKGGSGKIRFQGEDVPTGGDVVTAVDGRPVELDDDLGRILDGYRPGQVTRLTVARGSKTRTVAVKLGKRPTSGG
jgi:S1-C subfamily serine protease